MLLGSIIDHAIPLFASKSGIECGVDLVICKNPKFLRESSEV